VSARAESASRIVNERIESAYLGLYGYEPRVQALYESATASLKLVDNWCYSRLLNSTQKNVLDLKGSSAPLASSQLGNTLRSTVAIIASAMNENTERIVAMFRSEMMRLMTAADSDIFKKRVRVSTEIDYSSLNPPLPLV
jgi:hypothetical protein